ncbi:MAG: FAD-dependent oxidoreductase [Bacteroidetes bacterium]|nr:FAD-dependent oxidoreductase [Bacteroidota bacterium]
MEHTTDIIIIGAGAAGLYAAMELSAKGKKVTVLEAREKTGGRIRSITGNFSKAMDAGPEFIHGDLPITKSLLKKAGSKFYKHKGEFYRSRNGKIVETDEMTEGWDRLMKELKGLKKDMTLVQFLDEHFGDEKDKELRREVIGLAEGFDAADANRISAFAVRNEWGGDTIDDSYQIEGGYTPLVDYLTAECRKNGCTFHFKTEVKKIKWQKGRVEIICMSGQVFEAPKVMITVSLGVLISENETCSIAFSPAIPAKITAAKQMGFGPIVKINFEFSTVFWNDANFKNSVIQIPDLGFLNSENEIPVWWTRAPDQPFLVGWAGGSNAEKLKQLSDDVLLKKAIASIAAAMNTTETIINEQLTAHAISNWGNDPFTKGAYSYDTPETGEAKKILSEPLEDTIFFAGEALGDHTGTVEAAMENAKQVVKKVLSL